LEGAQALELGEERDVPVRLLVAAGLIWSIRTFTSYSIMPEK